jgi:membrane protease YdiL (CAAX protease family)
MSSETALPRRPDIPNRPDLATPPRPDLPTTVPWGPLDAIPVFLLAMLMTAVAGVPATLLVSSSASRFVVAALIGELGFLGAVAFWLRVVRKAPLSALGAPRTPLRDLGAGLLGGGALVLVGWVSGIVVVTIAQLILGHTPVQPDQIPTTVQGPSLWLSGVIVVVAAPLGEEVFFRGFLYQALRRKFRVWPAALISAAVFAAVHISPILIFALFPIGIGLALIFERRRSLLSSMGAHALFNLVGMIVIALSR